MIEEAMPNIICTSKPKINNIDEEDMIFSEIKIQSKTMARFPSFHFDFLWTKYISMEIKSRRLANELLDLTLYVFIISENNKITR